MHYPLIKKHHLNGASTPLPKEARACLNLHLQKNYASHNSSHSTGSSFIHHFSTKTCCCRKGQNTVKEQDSMVWSDIAADAANAMVIWIRRTPPADVAQRRKSVPWREGCHASSSQYTSRNGKVVTRVRANLPLATESMPFRYVAAVCGKCPPSPALDLEINKELFISSFVLS